MQRHRHTSQGHGWKARFVYGHLIQSSKTQLKPQHTGWQGEPWGRVKVLKTKLSVKTGRLTWPNFKIDFTVSAIMAERYWHMDHWKIMERPKQSFDSYWTIGSNVTQNKTNTVLKTMVLSSRVEHSICKNPTTQKAEAEGMRVGGQSELWDTVSINKTGLSSLVRLHSKEK